MIVKCPAAMEYLGKKTLTNKPDHPQLIDTLWLESKEKHLDILLSVASQIILLFIDYLL